MLALDSKWRLLASHVSLLRWFARPGKMPAEPYFELPISLSKEEEEIHYVHTASKGL